MSNGVKKKFLKNLKIKAITLKMVVIHYYVLIQENDLEICLPYFQIIWFRVGFEHLWYWNYEIKSADGVCIEIVLSLIQNLSKIE